MNVPISHLLIKHRETNKQKIFENVYQISNNVNDVLVLSTFFSKDTWQADLEMTINPIMYGLTSEIFIAESSEEGAWSGVIDRLRKNRKILVPGPESYEKKAITLLIQKGAIPVNIFGKPILEFFQLKRQLVTNEVNESKIKK